jgi:limonene-1,2-epoxide hydrolase
MDPYHGCACEVSFDPVSAVTTYHAALEARDFASLAQIYADEVEYTSVGIGSINGRNALMAALVSYFEKHPDQKAWDESVIAVDARKAQSVWQIRMNDPVTGQQVARSGTEIVTFNAAGKILNVQVFDAA